MKTKYMIQEGKMVKVDEGYNDTVRDVEMLFRELAGSKPKNLEIMISKKLKEAKNEELSSNKEYVKSLSIIFWYMIKYLGVTMESIVAEINDLIKSPFTIDNNSIFKEISKEYPRMEIELKKMMDIVEKR